MSSKKDVSTTGPALPQEQQTAATWQGGEEGRLLSVLAHLAAALQSQNELLKLIHGQLQAPRNQVPTLSDFPPGSDARKAADTFNDILARLSFTAPRDASGQ